MLKFNEVTHLFTAYLRRSKRVIAKIILRTIFKKI